MEKLLYKLENFEGPLDLLLALISKNKLNIFDIQISLLCDQYVEQINRMKDLDMNMASEFLEMAARLVYIKTVSLLPKREEAEALKQELTGQLLEYQECKEAAKRLAACLNQNLYVRQPQEFTPDRTYTRVHDVHELLAAYLCAVGRGKRFMPPPAESFSGIVSRRIVSVMSQAISVLRRLWRDHEIRYGDLFNEKEEKSERVAAFLALLELVKEKRVRVDGENENARIRLIARKKGGRVFGAKKAARRD